MVKKADFKHCLHLSAILALLITIIRQVSRNIKLINYAYFSEFM